MTIPENDTGDYRNKILALLSNLKFGDSFDKNAFSAISSLERKPTIDILISILDHPNPEIRTQASEVLLRLDAKSSQEFILPLLKL